MKAKHATPESRFLRAVGQALPQDVDEAAVRGAINTALDQVGITDPESRRSFGELVLAPLADVGDAGGLPRLKTALLSQAAMLEIAGGSGLTPESARDCIGSGLRLLLTPPSASSRYQTLPVKPASDDLAAVKAVLREKGPTIEKVMVHTDQGLGFPLKDLEGLSPQDIADFPRHYATHHAPAGHAQVAHGQAVGWQPQDPLELEQPTWAHHPQVVLDSNTETAQPFQGKIADAGLEVAPFAFIDDHGADRYLMMVEKNERDPKGTAAQDLARHHQAMSGKPVETAALVVYAARVQEALRMHLGQDDLAQIKAGLASGEPLQVLLEPIVEAHLTGDARALALETLRDAAV